jgi:hypothetical protein
VGRPQAIRVHFTHWVIPDETIEVYAAEFSDWVALEPALEGGVVGTECIEAEAGPGVTGD